MGLAELAQRRARIYRTLAIACARPADEALLAQFRSWGGLSDGAFPAMMRRGLGKTSGWLARAGSPPSADSLTALQGEFSRLFRGLSRSHSPPPPYESVYRDGGLLYGPSTAQVAEGYRRFQLKGPAHEPPDHIAQELDFMGFLCEREAQGWRSEGGSQDWLKEEQAFLNAHLARWVPAWGQQVRKADTSGFYEGLVDIIQGWVSCDQVVIRGLLRERKAVLKGSPPGTSPGSPPPPPR